jgi:hypothetical protein
MRTGAHELPLEIKAASFGHLQVEHQAVGQRRMRQRREKIVCRCEGVGVETGWARQALERLANGRVVIDDHDPVAVFPYDSEPVSHPRKR